MANNKRRFFLRYISIIQKLRSNECSFEEMENHLQSQSEISGEELNITRRTFQRDIQDIADIFNIEIKCNSKYKYFIAGDDDEELKRRRLETIDQLDLLYKTKYNSKYVFYESRVPAGTENIFGILHAIHQRLLIYFRHEKNWEEKITYRTVEPYALKESQNRWYLIAKDRGDGKVKTFGLDRITELRFDKQKFSYPKDLDIDEMFRYSFGIMTESKKVEHIVLSFDRDQRKYLGSLQLHSSQTEIPGDKDEFRIKLKMRITFDFKKELLSYGDLVEVISPISLRKEIRDCHQRAYKMNS